ncbi:D-2-hydroxyacid dehydrogenase family protein [Polynucleobacter kasalickyi]|uniref:Phosphoglycerate dehydrogenase n=1 Tax=Polynucleobacter kasalickyi TaxID=1938817 RepID=A0A1W1ZIT9_9BURK|nr:D-2-hydroxyacid dehydrogenase family protein [Polynucleobacter kasalickyi]SMC48297.1 Phosphoglycerate dehydrogenase [Polynucleobacter kasalickyi]
MKIVVLDDYEKSMIFLKDNNKISSKASIQIHHQRLIGDALVDAIRDANVVVLMRDRTPFRAELINQLNELQYVIFTGNRNMAIDYDVLAAKNIPVSYTEFGPSKETTVELTWALILSAYKRIGEQNLVAMSGAWRNEHSVLPALHGERLGVLGLGSIGSKVAKVGLAFGMDVVTWSPNMTPERAAVHGVKAVSLEELLQTSRIVSLHLVPGEGTKYVMNAERLAMMRADSFLVNTSRSTLIVTADLVQALQNGKPSMALLDVFDQEPINLEEELFKLPNVFITPHLGFVHQPIFKNLTMGAQAALEAWVSGEPLVNQVQ